MKNNKPTIICSGLFENRHKTLVSKLEKEFDIVLFAADGNWTGKQRLYVGEQVIEKSTLNRVAKTYRNFITDIESKFNLKEQIDKKNDVIDYLLRLWVQSYCIQHSLRKFHANRRITAVLAVNDQLAPIRTLVDFGTKNNIPTFYIEHGFIIASFTADACYVKDDSRLPVTDVVCVDNEVQKEYYADYYSGRAHQPEIIVTGNPIDGILTFQEIKKSGDTGKATILYCPSWFEANSMQEIIYGNSVEHKAFQLFCEMIKKLSVRMSCINFDVVVKLHPTLTKSIGVNTAGYFEKIAASFNIRLTGIDDGPLQHWLDKADLVVTSRNSSVSWEAFLCQVPCITYLFQFYKNVLRPEKWKTPTYLSRWGLQVYLDEQDDWSTSAHELIQSHRSGEFAKLCNKHLQKITFTSASEASQNIIRLIHQKAEAEDGLQKPSDDDAGTSKLRVLQIVHNFPPQSYSGTELYTLTFSKELKKLGHDVTVLYPVHDSKRKSLQFDDAEFEGLKVVRFNVFQPGKKKPNIVHNKFDAPFRAFFKKHDFDIVHIQHLFGLSANWVGVAKEAGLPVLMKIDDMYLYCPQGHLVYKNQSSCSGPESLDKCYECTFAAKSSNDPEYIASIFYYLALRREVLQRMFQQVDFVHTPSQFLKETSIANNLNNREFHVIPTGISPFEIQQRKKEGGVVRIGFMGEIDIRKGIGIFLDAIKQANSTMGVRKQACLQFKIYGRHFDDDLYHTMTAKVNDLKNATYLGCFTTEQRAQVFSEIDLLVMPSLGENYPFILREALYAGIPAVATAIAGVPEIIIDGENGFLIPPGDVEALADIFVKIAHSPTFLELPNLQKTKIKLIEQDAQEFEQIYFNLVQHKSVAAGDDIRAFQEIRELISEKKFIDGLNLLAKIIDENPQHPEALNLMGEIYERLGKTTEAVELQNMAKQLSE